MKTTSHQVADPLRGPDSTGRPSPAADSVGRVEAEQRTFRSISLDLEVGVENRRIRAFAAIRGDTGQTVVDSRFEDVQKALGELDRLVPGADVVLGHNLIGFDLPHLRAAAPDLQLLDLPAVDTLRLNPLAFPKNPYHHLVKHYQDGQLKRGRINDPELDARLVLEVFDDQLRALAETDPDLLTAWHWLTSAEDGDGFGMVFASLRGSSAPSEHEGRVAVKACLDGVSCETHAKETLDDGSISGWPLAYALAWLSVSGSNSVMPPWVRHQFPEAGRIVQRLRDKACTDSTCGWCRERHDARAELTRWFGFDDFRPEPEHHGASMQGAVVEASMSGKHVLAILPTGSGKSLCYQLPALSRYDKTGALTVVISPLVALMADQVTGLEAKGIGSCVTINGLLSMPERKNALDRVRLGDAGILLVSPEQLRNTSFRRVLAQREIGSWVLDEAHCLSKWGHDFRPDYRYVGRFIREKAGDGAIPPVLCLTATAKPEVKSEIVQFFKNELGVDLGVFDGGAQRSNLEFVVVQTTPEGKLTHIYEILESDLPPGSPGGAIVYCATRRRTQEVAEFLRAKGMEADYFHAGLPPETKKNVQDGFIGGGLRAIAATNAFGMGIDKPDVRVVIHADVPGSLENYLQEAGRAGRDRGRARCVLLYTMDDVERQFGMSARSRLTRRAIHGVLRALRNLDRKKRLGGEVIATAGEILGEDEENAFVRDSATDDNRVRTAVAWLEDSELLARDENMVQVFPSSLRVGSVEEAAYRLWKADVEHSYGRRLLTIAEALVEADPDEGISTDELMAASGLTPEGVRKALYDLEQLGIASNDTALTAFVHVGVRRGSRRRFEEASALEEALIELMREMVPDQEKGETQQLHLRVATQRLKDDEHAHALPEYLRRIVRSIAADGRGEGGGGGSIGVRGVGAETLQITLHREWRLLERAARVRRAAAGRLLDHLLAALPPGARGTDLLAETTLGRLLAAIKSDMMLTKGIRDPSKLMDRALMWLHEQEVVRLNKGLAVFRPAMTIRLSPERRGFARSDFATLQLHYDEQVLQIHVMAEYVNRGLGAMADALRLAMDYFNMGREEFLGKWLPDRGGEISRQTTPESWRAIVEDLRNPFQRRIVADDRERTNVLVLAGPGSGKTRVLVHRIAYLIRVRRENPRGILALAYNRHAAAEVRRRLADLVGDDARGVMVLTCHALAMRMVGASFAGRAGSLEQEDFRGVLREATVMLRGDGLPSDEADEQRTRLLAGFRWILVDEYQDVGADEYALISALAGRTLADEDARLGLFAVGDDDQNIYSFNGSSVEFIRRFESDYGASPAYLTGNYRSSRNIVDAANATIEPSRERMKAGRSITVDRARADDPPGGLWSEIDPITRGRVQILDVGGTPVDQARSVVEEYRRMADLDPGWDWASCAVIARSWRALEPVRSLCEIDGVPVQLANEEFGGFWHLRETRSLVDRLRRRSDQLVQGAELARCVDELRPGHWAEMLKEAVEEYVLESGGVETPVENFVEWLAEWGREARRRQRGLLLLTAHRAKGLEFDHVSVLDGGWGRVGRNEDSDAPRRLYYVAMTRARRTLTLARQGGIHPIVDVSPDDPSTMVRAAPVHTVPAAPELSRRYERLDLKDVFLGYAGYRDEDHPIHGAIAALSPGDKLEAREGPKRWELLDGGGVVVGQLALSFDPPAGMRCATAKVFAVATWSRERSEPEYRDGYRCDSWEVVLPELVFEPFIRS